MVAPLLAFWGLTGLGTGAGIFAKLARKPEEETPVEQAADLTKWIIVGVIVLVAVMFLKKKKVV